MISMILLLIISKILCTMHKFTQNNESKNSSAKSMTNNTTTENYSKNVGNGEINNDGYGLANEESQGIDRRTQSGGNFGAGMESNFGGNGASAGEELGSLKKAAREGDMGAANSLRRIEAKGEGDDNTLAALANKVNKASTMDAATRDAAGMGGFGEGRIGDKVGSINSRTGTGLDNDKRMFGQSGAVGKEFEGDIGRVPGALSGVVGVGQDKDKSSLAMQDAKGLNNAADLSGAEIQKVGANNEGPGDPGSDLASGLSGELGNLNSSGVNTGIAKQARMMAKKPQDVITGNSGEGTLGQAGHAAGLGAGPPGGGFGGSVAGSRAGYAGGGRKKGATPDKKQGTTEENAAKAVQAGEEEGRKNREASSRPFGPFTGGAKNFGGDKGGKEGFGIGAGDGYNVKKGEGLTGGAGDGLGRGAGGDGGGYDKKRPGSGYGRYGGGPGVFGPNIQGGSFPRSGGVKQGGRGDDQIGLRAIQNAMDDLSPDPSKEKALDDLLKSVGTPDQQKEHPKKKKNKAPKSLKNLINAMKNAIMNKKSKDNLPDILKALEKKQTPPKVFPKFPFKEEPVAKPTPEDMIPGLSDGLPQEAVNAQTPEGAAANAETPEGAAGNTQTPEGRSANSQTPEGAAANAQTPEGAAANTQTPEGTAANTQTPEGRSANSQTPEGAAANAQTPEGAAANTQTPEGTAANAQTPEGAAANTQTPEGRSANAQTPQGAAANAQTPEGQLANTQTPIGRAANENTTGGKIANAENMPDFDESDKNKSPYEKAKEDLDKEKGFNDDLKGLNDDENAINDLANAAGEEAKKEAMQNNKGEDEAKKIGENVAKKTKDKMKKDLQDKLKEKLNEDALKNQYTDPQAKKVAKDMKDQILNEPKREGGDEDYSPKAAAQKAAEKAAKEASEKGLTPEEVEKLADDSGRNAFGDNMKDLATNEAMNKGNDRATAEALGEDARQNSFNEGDGKQLTPEEGDALATKEEAIKNALKNEKDPITAQIDGIKSALKNESAKPYEKRDSPAKQLENDVNTNTLSLIPQDAKVLPIKDGIMKLPLKDTKITKPENDIDKIYNVGKQKLQDLLRNRITTKPYEESPLNSIETPEGIYNLPENAKDMKINDGDIIYTPDQKDKAVADGCKELFDTFMNIGEFPTLPLYQMYYSLKIKNKSVNFKGKNQSIDPCFNPDKAAAIHIKEGTIKLIPWDSFSKGIKPIITVKKPLPEQMTPKKCKFIKDKMQVKKDIIINPDGTKYLELTPSLGIPQTIEIIDDEAIIDEADLYENIVNPNKNEIKFNRYSNPNIIPKESFNKELDFENKLLNDINSGVIKDSNVLTRRNSFGKKLDDQKDGIKITRKKIFPPKPKIVKNIKVRINRNNKDKKLKKVKKILEKTKEV